MTSEQHVWLREQMLAVRLLIIGAVLTFLIALIAGLMADSVALLLDAAVGLVAIFVTFFILMTIKTINKPPDDIFNFGYEKCEPLTVVLQGTMIIVSCAVAGKFAVQDIIHPENVTRYDLPVLGSLVLFVISAFMAAYLKRVAVRTHSAIFHMSSYHWKLDAWMAFGMFAGFGFGLLLRDYGYEPAASYVDPVMTLILILFLLQSPLETIKRNGLELLDAAPDGDIKNKVSSVIEKHKPKSFGIHRVRTRKAGKKLFIDVGFLVHGSMTVKEARVLAECVEKDIVSHFAGSDVVVYFHPADSMPQR
ncbi:MAG: cation diffusion facilitator family transporter [Candidatus Omnitrophota bacterium]